MARHNELGKEGETAAAFYLEGNGYRIRHRNWFNQHKELDLEAEKEGELIIAEVKTRSSGDYSQPEEVLTPAKIRRIVKAADAYVKQYELDLPVRFDFFWIIQDQGRFRIEHYPSAFHAPLW